MFLVREVLVSFLDDLLYSLKIHKILKLLVFAYRWLAGSCYNLFALPVL